MMTTPDQVAIRAVFVYPKRDTRALPPTHRLLSDLGHEVTTTPSFSEAMDMLRETSVDLLILEEDADSIPAGRPFREYVMEQINELPPQQRPRDVAIYTEKAEGTTSTPRQREGLPKVHVLLKPLHVHGLLHVLRHLESRLVH